MITKQNKNEARKKRHYRVRKKITGTAQRPRLNVYRSLSNIYAQLINDETGQTLASASSLDKEIKSSISYGGNKEAAKAVGALIATRAKECNIEKVVFDRGGFIFHGRVRELAEAAREAGLDF